MNYKVTIKSTPEYTATIKARSVKEAKRIAIRNALLIGIHVLYSDDKLIEEIE